MTLLQLPGIVLGLTPVSGQLLNAYSVATTAAADIPKWNFGFFQVNMIGYQAQVLPAILASFTLVYLEKFFRRITPQVVSMIVGARSAEQSPKRIPQLYRKKDFYETDKRVETG